MSKIIIEWHLVMEQDVGEIDIDNDAIRQSLESLHATMLKSSLQQTPGTNVKQLTVKFHKPTDPNKLN